MQITTNRCTLHKLPDEFANKQHVIQYEAVIEEGNEDLVHHMEVFHCEVDVTEELPDYQGPCADENKPPILEHCKRVIAAWAMGAEVIKHRVGIKVIDQDDFVDLAARVPTRGRSTDRWRKLLALHYARSTL